MRIFLRETIAIDNILTRKNTNESEDEATLSLLDEDDESRENGRIFRKMSSFHDSVSLLKSSLTFSQAAVVMFFLSLGDVGLSASLSYYLKACFHFDKEQYADLMIVSGIAGTVSQVILMPMLAPLLGEQKLLSIGIIFGSAHPTFATSYGGPAEIIVHGKSGFHIDLYHGDQVSEQLVDFYAKCKEDPSYWEKISTRGLQRIMEKYTWQIYSERLMTLAGVYGFWKYVSKLNRREIRRYLEMFYGLKFSKMAESVPLAAE